MPTFTLLLFTLHYNILVHQILPFKWRILGFPGQSLYFSQMWLNFMVLYSVSVCTLYWQGREWKSSGFSQPRRVNQSCSARVLSISNFSTIINILIPANCLLYSLLALILARLYSTTPLLNPLQKTYKYNSLNLFHSPDPSLDTFVLIILSDKSFPIKCKTA